MVFALIIVITRNSGKNDHFNGNAVILFDGKLNKMYILILLYMQKSQKRL